MITISDYMFRAIIVLDASAYADAARRLLDRTTPRCVLQPCDGKWFPAAVSVSWSPSQERTLHAVLRVRLLPREPEAFFPAGQPFTLWADAIVDDHAVRGEGRLGDGVIVSQEFAGTDAPRTADRPAVTYRRRVSKPRPDNGASQMAGR